ncbi:VOC family protein [Cohnella soli]|uniref:VOC family protein n=1 Tax=Cohnella soli TaxID=425005 RepID=A0ABW0HXC0_9BACL
MIIGFHHAQITVSKEQEKEAKSFYCGVLQLSELEKPDSLKGRGGFWVQVGNQELHIGIEEGIDRKKTKAHLAYQVEEIEIIKDKLTSIGIEVLEAIPIPGYERFECRDPFGNRIEFIKLLV